MNQTEPDYDALFPPESSQAPSGQPQPEAMALADPGPPPTYDEMAVLMDTLCENQQMLTALLEKILDAVTVPENDSVIKVIEEVLQPIKDDTAAIKVAVGA